MAGVECIVLVFSFFNFFLPLPVRPSTLTELL